MHFGPVAVDELTLADFLGEDFPGRILSLFQGCPGIGHLHAFLVADKLLVVAHMKVKTRHVGPPS